MPTNTEGASPMNTVWIARVDTYYGITAVDTDPEAAVTKACKFALKWLRDNGVTEHRTVAEVREFFGVTAMAVTVGTAVLDANAPHHI
jgi:hypothetical protein